MSTEKPDGWVATHSDLVKAAIRHARKTCPIVISEIATTGEEPDVLGWQSSGVSILYECKASREDFNRDSSKPHRARPDAGVGQARYYFTPKNLIDEEELPTGWGLIEFDGKRFYRKRGSGVHKAFETHEKTILISVLRRIGQTRPKGVSISPYFYSTQNRAELHLEVDELPAAPQGEEWHNWTPDYCNHADAESAKLTYDGKLYHYGTSIGESRQVCCSCSGPNPNSARQRFLALVSEIDTEASECLVPENKKTND